MALKSRFQNPVITDTVELQMFVFNSNNTADVDSISKVEIYYLDPTMQTPSNPNGQTLVETVPGGSVSLVQQGEYQINLYLDPTIYLHTGRYVDQWYTTFQSGEPETTIFHLFTVYPDLWYTTPIPMVYDFNFYFQPNRIRFGSKRYIDIEIVPNVPTATDLQQYYENLAIVSDVKVSIAKRCGPCAPVGADCEEDLSLIVDKAQAQYKEKNRAFYFIDTTEFDCGVYDIWFQMDFGNNIFISEKFQIQFYA